MVGFFDKKHFYQFIFPIENLEITKRSFTIGKVRFFEYNNYQLNRIMKKIRKVIDQNQYYNQRPQAKKNVIAAFRRYYELNLNNNSNKTCAIAEAYGHIDDTVLQALHDVKIAVNVFKLYRYQNDNFYRTYFGIQGEIITRNVRAILAKASHSEKYRPTVEAYGCDYPFRVDTARINFMKNNGFNIIDKMLKKSKSNFNALDRRIISAINWYGESFNSHVAVREKYRSLYRPKRIGIGKPKNYGLSEPERLIFCITALEGLFLFSNREKHEKVGERISKIIGRDITARYEKLYEIRCSIVHGSRSYVDKNELDDIFGLTRSAIISLIIRKGRLGIKNVPYLRKWLK